MKNESRYIAIAAFFVLTAVIISGIFVHRSEPDYGWVVTDRIKSASSYTFAKSVMIPTDQEGRLEITTLFKVEGKVFTRIRETRVAALESTPNPVPPAPPKKKIKVKCVPIPKSRRALLPIINAAAQKYSVDPDLVKAVIMAESNYNPKAVSNKGARGLMQLMPRTAVELGVKDPFNPEHNIYGGVKYLKKLLTRFQDDMRLAVAAYNAGTQRVIKYKDVPPFKATQYYVEKVIVYYHFYKEEKNSKSNEI